MSEAIGLAANESTYRCPSPPGCMCGPCTWRRGREATERLAARFDFDGTIAARDVARIIRETDGGRR